MIILLAINKVYQLARNLWKKSLALIIGLIATLWFLIRVLPRPSRAAYPCQQVAFPLASGFVVWLISLFAIKPLMSKIKDKFPYRLGVGTVMMMLLMASFLAWTIAVFYTDISAETNTKTTRYDFVPAKANDPQGIARGIFPGRVVWAHDPEATKWQGNWKSETDQWWLDKNTDQQKVDEMLATALLELTGQKNTKNAWKAIFEYYNRNARDMNNRTYQEGEMIGLKVNLNNSVEPNKTNNYSDASPQLILTMIRQLVHKARVAPENILVIDAQRCIPPYILTKVWSEFKDVRFVQKEAPTDGQPKNPAYGDYHGLEAADWIEGISYSNGKYNKARFIPRQVYEATYIINMAMLKAHSYPYNIMADGDEGQTGITMGGKNHFGTIQGPWELHAAINTNQEAVKNAYSPLVDLAASPNLGAKTILFILDGLYCGRKWRSYPVHFPNPPFNNPVEPYENANWPASILASFDGVAIDCVGLDIYYSQTKNNFDREGRSRLLLRENADDYLLEMARTDNPPSGTYYMQSGEQISSLGVHEHWDNDNSRKYSRNLNPDKGQGIELIYVPL